MKLYHFTDEEAVEGIKSEGFVDCTGRSSFFVAWPPDDEMPQGRSNCTWVVIAEIPDAMVERQPNNWGVYEVPNEILSDYRHTFQYERVSSEQRTRWGFHGP
jgi:hypothetical protein